MKTLKSKRSLFGVFFSLKETISFCPFLSIEVFGSPLHNESWVMSQHQSLCFSVSPALTNLTVLHLWICLRCFVQEVGLNLGHFHPQLAVTRVRGAYEVKRFVDELFAQKVDLNKYRLGTLENLTAFYTIYNQYDEFCERF